ncbi:MAG: UbiA family prenyltransferase [Thermoplasmatales archaeon]|nr:UbiA family prenyltransferase [Thermoplasmatales archaeon]
MDRYLRLFRFGNGVMGFVGILVGAFVAAGMDIGDHLANIAVACASTLLVMAGGNSLNDYVDREIDKTAHPERPIPSGEIKAETAKILGISLILLAIPVSFLTKDPVSVVIVAAASVLMLSYEFVLKKRGFVGNVAIGALTGAIFLLGCAVVGDVDAGYILAALAAIVTVGREVAKDIEDMESDEGRRTLPMSIGRGRAAAVSSAFFVLGPALSAIPFLTGALGVLYVSVLVADVLFIHAAFIVHKEPARAQKLAKVAMAAALVSFVLGVLK